MKNEERTKNYCDNKKKQENNTLKIKSKIAKHNKKDIKNENQKLEKCKTIKPKR